MPALNHACQNSSCSHICLLASNKSFTCACPENMELENRYTCKFTKQPENIILGIGSYVVAVPQQTLGRHIPSNARQIENNVDQLEFNSLTGELFVADNKFGRIKTVDMVTGNESILVDQHIMSVRSMAFGELTENIP